MFGIARMTWSWPRVPVRAAVVAPAMTDRTSCPRRRWGPISRPTRPSIWGLMANSTTSAPSIAATLSETTRMPYSRSRWSRRSARGWLATTWLASTSSPRSRPAIIASAMTPEPTVAIVRFARGTIGGVSHGAVAALGPGEDEAPGFASSLVRQPDQRTNGRVVSGRIDPLLRLSVREPDQWTKEA